MITIKTISSEEAAQLNREAGTSFWTLFIGLSFGVILIAALCRWLFNAPYVEITLSDAPARPPCPGRNTFEIWRTIGMTYYQQDNGLRHSYQQLVGQEVEIGYLPDAGTVLAFRLLNASSSNIRQVTP